MHVALTLSSFEATVITASPPDTAVSAPLLSTETTDISDEVHLKTLTVASFGKYVTLREYLSPTIIFNDVLLSATSSISIIVESRLSSVSSLPHDVIITDNDRIYGKKTNNIFFIIC